MINIITIMLSGVLATTVMCIFLEMVTRAKLANADMVRAVGSVFTGSYENSLKPGLVIQFGSGIIFSFIYFGTLSYFSTGPAAVGAVMGAVIGLFHGMVVGLGIVVAVAEHHPVARFREAGFMVAASHVFGHMIYGLIIGTIFAATGIRIFVTS